MTDAAPAPTPRDAATSSEAKVLTEIVAWSANCPAWQRDAVRRLCTQGELTETDLEHLTRLCKGETNDVAPLGNEHVRDARAAAAPVLLRAIRHARHVNALAEGQILTFNKAGLTVIYGDNGSGKSGYARILKRACRARSPKGDRILPNIYARTTGRPTAALDYSVGGQNRTDIWADESALDPALSSVSVFDHRTANVHVDQTNDVAYTPLPMKILEQLAEACQAIRKRISDEVGALEQQTPSSLRNPECHPQTQVGRLIDGLSDKTDTAEIEALAAMTPEETARFESLRADFSGDPAKAARHLQSVKGRLVAHAQALQRLQAAITDTSVHHLRLQHGEWQAAARAAAVAADELFSDEPLQDIGSEAWRALWEAARTYSQVAAYPDRAFPFTGEGARCVLCQQELDWEAAARLLRFEEFVKAETQRKEEEARTAYEAALEERRDVDVSVAEIRSLVDLLRNEVGDEALTADVRRAALTAKLRLRAILRTHVNPDEVELPKPPPFPEQALVDRIDGIGERITALLGEEQSEERRRLRAKYDALADRAWLAVVKDDVKAEVGRRKQIAALKAALKDTTTNRITAKSAEVAEELVTNALRAQFSKEVARLGVAELAIELRKEKSSYGVPLFRVCLMKKPEARVGEILSEGEYRCVALAAFLAELATTEGNSAIVFDDPVSSLDHMHRVEVANRLADEGQWRQVVVFTHDIAFLFLLDQACRDRETQISFRSVTRTTEETGFCQQDAPGRAQLIEKVIESLQRRLDNERVQYERGDREGWERSLDSLAKRLRDTWERAVEEAVAPVIRRFSHKVETKGLGKVTAVTLDDCRIMREAYGRCSELMHSVPEVLNPPLPKPEAVQVEIDALREWVADVKRRQEQVGSLK